MRITVECMSDSRGEERPVRLRLNSKSILVSRVLDRWPGFDFLYFKVEGEDGARYIIRRDERTSEWDLIKFDRRPHEAED